jgi:hypothetical protein
MTHQMENILPDPEAAAAMSSAVSPGIGIPMHSPMTNKNTAG